MCQSPEPRPSVHRPSMYAPEGHRNSADKLCLLSSGAVRIGDNLQGKAETRGSSSDGLVPSGNLSDLGRRFKSCGS